MNLTAFAWALAGLMAGWAVYLFFAWHGAASLPMQWGLTGRPTWYASRGVAVAFIPCLAIAVLAAMTFAPPQHHTAGRGILVTSVLMLCVQAIWVFFARRYVS
jgi:hypothetical protein